MSPGTRVGAILSFAKDEVEFLGYGEYVGDRVPDEAVGPVAEALREYQQRNPCIKLDNGEFVFGCECWWGTEEEIKTQLKKAKNVRDVDISTVRKEFLQSTSN
jgi:hypothetical protein